MSRPSTRKHGSQITERSHDIGTAENRVSDSGYKNAVKSRGLGSHRWQAMGILSPLRLPISPPGRLLILSTNLSTKG